MKLGRSVGGAAEDKACHCRLSKKTKFDKRIAVTVFSFPPDKGNVGTAAYLNVFGSIQKVLKVGCSLSGFPALPHRNVLLPPTAGHVYDSACNPAA